MNYRVSQTCRFAWISVQLVLRILRSATPGACLAFRDVCVPVCLYRAALAALAFDGS